MRVIFNTDGENGEMPWPKEIRALRSLFMDEAGWSISVLGLENEELLVA